MPLILSRIHKQVIKMKKGDVIEYKGMLARIVRKSQRTGGLTIELLNDYAPAYTKGLYIHVMPYECVPAIISRTWVMGGTH